MRHRVALLFAALTVLAVVRVASAAPPLPAGCHRVRPAMAFHDAPLEDVIRYVSRATRASFIVPAPFNARPISIVFPRRIARSERLWLLINALRSTGLRVARRGSFLRLCDPDAGPASSHRCRSEDPLY